MVLLFGGTEVVRVEEHSEVLLEESCKSRGSCCSKL